jgi:hypothetical protein
MVQAECTGWCRRLCCHNNDADDLADDISGTSVTPVDEGRRGHLTCYTRRQ